MTTMPKYSRLMIAVIINQFISKIIYLHSVAEGRLSEEAYNFTWRSAQRA
jgi:hypothetical protein